MRHGWLASVRDPKRVVRNDALAAGGLAAVFALIAIGAGSWVGGVGTAILSMQFSTLVIRRVAPITFGMLNAVLCGIGFATGQLGLDFVSALLVLIGVYSIAAFAPKRWHWLGLASLPAAALLLIGSLLNPRAALDDGLAGLIIGLGFVTAFYAAAWALGYARRARFEARAQELERLRLLEQDAHRLAELAVADERTRISREMHDIIAHSLASIITLAEGGRMAAARDPELGTKLFERIGTAGRDALTDVKRLLRNVDEAQGDEPAHGVDEIGALVETAALGGLPISLEVAGEPRALPAGKSLAVYRVVQESITNVLKHAPGARTEVRLHWLPERLEVEIENELPESRSGESSAPGSRRGLAGMRERVELFDGAFAANRTGGRFCVSTTWPYER